MAYSSYGAYVWRWIGGEWIRYMDSEDTSIKNFLANNPPPKDRPLEEATGLKFDVLLHADGMKQDSDWHTEHAHHAVFGDDKVVVSAHKQWLDCLCIDGKVKGIKVDRWSDDYTIRLEEVEWNEILPDGYSIGLQSTTYGIAVHLVTPTDMWLAYVGYGIGDHWWQDDEGYNIHTPAYKYSRHNPKTNMPIYFDANDNIMSEEKAFTKGKQYSREQHALDWCLRKFKW